MTNALEAPMIISPAAAQGAMYRARHVSRECRRALTGGSVAFGGSFVPLDGPVGIRPPPWTGKCYQIAVAIAAIMSAKHL
jgi:hypothetical protein